MQKSNARFDRDAINHSGARRLIIFEGVNDISGSLHLNPSGYHVMANAIDLNFHPLKRPVNFNDSQRVVLRRSGKQGGPSLDRKVEACLPQFLCLIFLFIAGAGFAVASDLPRERISINDDWRFTKCDPTNCPVNLAYDVRTNESATKSPLVINQWILPTGNNFIKDPSRKYARTGRKFWR